MSCEQIDKLSLKKNLKLVRLFSDYPEIEYAPGIEWEQIEVVESPFPPVKDMVHVVRIEEQFLICFNLFVSPC